MAETKKKSLLQRRLGEKLQAVNITQKELCGKCSISENSLSRYMTGERIPNSKTLATIANALHTTTSYLLGEDGCYGYDEVKSIVTNSREHFSADELHELLGILLEAEYKQQQGGGTSWKTSQTTRKDGLQMTPAR